MYQQSTDAVSEDISVSKRMIEERNINHVSMLVTMSQMLQDIGNLEEARGHLEDALQRLRQSLLSHNLLEAKTLCTLGTVFHKHSNSNYNRTQPICCPPLHMVLQIQSPQLADHCSQHNEKSL